jgi:hypothetical protein
MPQERTARTRRRCAVRFWPRVTLERSALVAEVVSGVAVVLTLVFLAVSIRANTAVTRAAAYEDLLDSINQFNLAIVNDAELAAIWTAFRTGRADELDEQASTRLILMARVLFRSYEAAYFFREYGILGRAEWERFGTTICSTYANTTSTFWPDVRSVLSSDFAAYIEGDCVAR